MIEVPSNLPRCGYSTGCDGGYALPFSLSNTYEVPITVRLVLARNFYYPGVGKLGATGAEITGFNVVMMDGMGKCRVGRVVLRLSDKLRTPGL